MERNQQIRLSDNLIDPIAILTVIRDIAMNCPYDKEIQINGDYLAVVLTMVINILENTQKNIYPN